MEREESGGEDERSKLLVKIGEGWEPEDHSRGWEMVATSRGTFLCEDDISVFPPSNHEGLLVEETAVAATEVKSAAISPPSRHPLSRNGVDSRWPVRYLLERDGRGRNLVEFVRRALDSSLEWFKISSASVKGGGIWSFGAMVGLTVLLLYSQHRCRREKVRLLLLIKEKDQTITWLSQHIAQMNELMTNRLIVPVSRNA